MFQPYWASPIQLPSSPSYRGQQTFSLMSSIGEMVIQPLLATSLGTVLWHNIFCHIVRHVMISLWMFTAVLHVPHIVGNHPLVLFPLPWMAWLFDYLSCAKSSVHRLRSQLVGQAGEIEMWDMASDLGIEASLPASSSSQNLCYYMLYTTSCFCFGLREP